MLFQEVRSGTGEINYKAMSAEESPLPPEDAGIFDDESPDDVAIGLRPYQHKAVDRIESELYGTNPSGEEPGIDPHKSTLLVLATGLGKTVVASQVIKRRKTGKALFIAHRSELIYQAKTTLESLTGEMVSVEMADRWADPRASIIVATVQTLISGMGGDGRMIAFDPNQFSLLVSDECHHSTADSYKRIYDYFHKNPNLKHFGLTATPDRSDEEALGKVFESVAMTYEISDAIHDGWLVPIKAVPVHIAGLDYSHIRTTAGDLNGADLAKVMEDETPLHEMVQAIIEVVSDAPHNSLAAALKRGSDAGFHEEMATWLGKYTPKKTLVFAATVKHAERLSEIINRWIPNSSCWLCGTTPKDERKILFADYKRGRYKFLVNVGVATEGWDEPSVEVVVMARPTKSRALYTQMLGRGTRCLPGIVDGLDTSDQRKAAIASSGKTSVTCVDFVGNCGKHTLVTPADILGGNYDDAVVERAKRNVEKGDRLSADMEAALEAARKEIEDQKAKIAATRSNIRVGSKYKIGAAIDPFKLFNVTPYRERGWERGKAISEKMRACLEKSGLWKDDMTYTNARQLIQGMHDRREKKLCTYKQASALSKRGLNPNVSFDTARRWLDAIASNGWQVPSSIYAESKVLK